MGYQLELLDEKEQPVLAVRTRTSSANLPQELGKAYGAMEVMLGYREDERVQRAIDQMLRTDRPDGGYLCDLHEKENGKPPKSCVRGSAKALLAFSELPEYHNHERCLELVDYFLSRNGIFRRNDHNRFVNRDMERDSFPIIWHTNLWEILYALSKMSYGRDERLDDAWDIMLGRRDDLGRYPLHWTPAQCPWKVGGSGAPTNGLLSME